MQATIQVSTHGAFSSNEGEQSISISHLKATRTALSNEMRLNASPGATIIWVNGGPVRIVSERSTHIIYEESSFIASGDVARFVLPANVSDEEVSSESTLFILEVNAIINESIFLAEHFLTPVVRGFEETASLQYIHEQLTSIEAESMYCDAQSRSKPLLAAFLVDLLLRAMPETEKKEVAAPALSAFKLYCSENLADTLSVNALANAMDMSSSVFYKWVKPLIGMTPGRYVRKMRLERCQELLTNTDLTLEIIADRCGFPNRYHLTREFTKLYGTPPIRYRKNIKQQGSEQLFADAARLIELEDYVGALDTLNDILNTSKAQEARPKALFMKAHCLSKIEQCSRAISIWQALQDTSYEEPARKELIRTLLTAGDHARALSEFARAYREGATRIREQLIGLWIDHTVSILQKKDAPALQSSLLLRRELFIDDTRSASLACHVILALGQDPLAMTESDALPIKEKVALLRKMGRFQDVLNSMKNEITPSQRAHILIQAGRYQEVLDNHPGCLKACADAMTALGKPELAIEEHPDCCNVALFELKRYEEILGRYPHHPDYRLDALHALGRLDEVIGDLVPGSRIHSLVQLHLDPKALLGETDNHLFYYAALFLEGVNALMKGQDSRARELLSTIPSPWTHGFWLCDHTEEELLLTPVLCEWLGEQGCIEQQFAFLHDHCRHAAQQRLWHTIGYITGNLDEKAFLSQPSQVHISTRLCFAQALRLDLEGHRKNATCHYNNYLEEAPPLLDMSCLCIAFARWRLSQIGVSHYQERGSN